MMKQKFLTRAEEVDLISRWKDQRDKRAREKLLTAHLPFVHKMAKKMAGYGVSIEDIAQEGMIGLIHSLDRFDPNVGTRFVTFAQWHIRAHMQEFISRNLRLVKLPEKAIKTPKSHAVEIQPDVPLDAVASPDSPDLKLIDALVDDRPNPEELICEYDAQQHLRLRIDAAMRKLPARSRAIIRSRYMGDEKETLTSIAERYQISHERVRQIEKQSLQMIRKTLRSAESSV